MLNFYLAATPLVWVIDENGGDIDENGDDIDENSPFPFPFSFPFLFLSLFLFLFLFPFLFLSLCLFLSLSLSVYLSVYSTLIHGTQPARTCIKHCIMQHTHATAGYRLAAA